MPVSLRRLRAQESGCRQHIIGPRRLRPSQTIATWIVFKALSIAIGVTICQRLLNMTYSFVSALPLHVGSLAALLYYLLRVSGTVFFPAELVVPISYSTLVLVAEIYTSRSCVRQVIALAALILYFNRS